MKGNPNIKDHGFKKGKSGNPNGRPKLPDLNEAMAKVLGGEEGAESGLQRVLNKLQQMAEKGNPKAIEILLDRGYGKAKQSLELKADIKGDVTIERHLKEKPDEG